MNRYVVRGEFTAVVSANDDDSALIAVHDAIAEAAGPANGEYAFIHSMERTLVRSETTVEQEEDEE